MILLRFIRRKLVLCVLLITSFAFLKEKLPQAGRYIGQWISGEHASHVVEAFSGMFEAFSDGEGLEAAVEVFKDGLQK